FARQQNSGGHGPRWRHRALGRGHLPSCGSVGNRLSPGGLLAGRRNSADTSRTDVLRAPTMGPLHENAARHKALSPLTNICLADAFSLDQKMIANAPTGK